MDALRAFASRAAVPAAVACAVLAPLAVHWLSGRTLVWFDTQRLYAPQRWLVDEALRSFRLPLWNPYLGAGMPFLADSIHGVLHPVSILTAWLATDRSADLLVGGYVACAGLGAWLLARDLGASNLGAALAAFTYATSGFVLSMTGNLVFLAGAGSMPFCVAGLRRFALDPRPGSLALGAGGAAMLALSGDAQALVVGGALALPLALEAGGWRGVARAIAAGCVGLLIAGVQLLPTAAHLPRSVRAEDSWTRTPTVWALEPWRLSELLLPGLLRGPDPYADAVYAGLVGPGRWPAGCPVPFSASVFVGLLPMVLAILGAREGRLGRLLGLLALVLLWIALGPALGADAVLRHVPIWRAFRYSEKLVGPLTLVLSALAGFGLDAAAERRRTGWRLLAVAATLGLAAVGVWYLELLRLTPAVAAVASGRLIRGTWHLLLAVGALGGWLLLRDRLGVTRARGSLAVLAWCGLATAAPSALSPGDPDSRLRAPSPALRSPPPGPRVMTPYFHDVLAGEDPSWLEETARLHARLAYPAYNVRARIESLNEYAAMPPARLALLGAASWSQWPLAPRRYGVTHLILDPPMDEPDRALYALVTRDATRIASSQDGYELWAVPHREWAGFPLEVRAVADERVALTRTAGLIADQSPAVVVEAWSPFDAAPGRVLSIERGLESLRIEAEAEADATLVVNDAWWPGWEAKLDGRLVPIFRADALVRAVRWPAGRHVLEMRYSPPEVRLGILASALGIAALAGWGAYLRRGRGRGPALTQPPREGPGAP